MRFITILLLVLVLPIMHAQFPVYTATDNTGLLATGDGGNDIVVNYNRSTTTLALSGKATFSKSRNWLKNYSTSRRQPFLALSCNIGFSISENSLPLYSEGKYSGGFENSLILSYNHNNKNETWMFTYYGGFAYKTLRNKFFENTPINNTVMIYDRLSHDIRFIGGVNTRVSTSSGILTLGLSTAPRYVIGSAINRDRAEQINLSNGINYIDQDGNTVNVVSEKKGFRGAPVQGWYGNPRLDLNMVFIRNKIARPEVSQPNTLSECKAKIDEYNLKLNACMAELDSCKQKFGEKNKKQLPVDSSKLNKVQPAANDIELDSCTKRLKEYRGKIDSCLIELGEKNKKQSPVDSSKLNNRPDSNDIKLDSCIKRLNEYQAKIDSCQRELERCPRRGPRFYALREKSGKVRLPYFGIYLSINSAFAQFGMPRYSFSVGPTLHLPKFSDQVLFGLFLEMNKVSRSKEFNEMFALNFYVGIPFSLDK